MKEGSRPRLFETVIYMKVSQLRGCGVGRCQCEGAPEGSTDEGFLSRGNSFWAMLRRFCCRCSTPPERSFHWRSTKDEGCKSDSQSETQSAVLLQSLPIVSAPDFRSQSEISVKVTMREMSKRKFRSTHDATV